MAETILFHIAESLLKNLGSRAADEIASVWGFKTSLKKLKSTITSINAGLLDAEKQQFESHAVSDWLERLKVPLYAADDLFDEFVTVASQRAGMGKVHTFFSVPKHIAFAFNISKRIKRLREELDDIDKDASRFNFVLPHLMEGRFHNQVRDQVHSLLDVEVIGREDDREAIIDTLMASSAAKEQRLSVISIVGIGGLGKTTLAKLLFNDKRLERHFELKLWVCVAEVFDLKEVVNKILKSATNNNEFQNLEMDQLQLKLRNEIGGKKYLLVLDDIWNENPDEWRKLRAILEVGGEGSMILVTTRSRKVADIMGTAHDLKGLSEEKSWSLFEKMAFEPEESQKKSHLMKLGKEVVKKCANVPLALRTLGTLLRGKEERKWISIAETSFADLHDEQNNVMPILKLSYHHLMSPLKKCFAYCALFPKDYKFEKEGLVSLWMAQGFIVPAYEKQSLEECGDEYLMLLLQRCFFQDVTRDQLGNILSFKMHDLMHDLALEVAGAESKMAKFEDKNFSDIIRHLSFDYPLTNLREILSFMLKAKHLRTFILPHQFQDGTDLNTAVLKQLISYFRCLRVLDLSHLGLKSLPKSVGKLIHLRYLNLSSNPIKELPNSITKLQNLQTLILRYCRELRALPIDTRKLTNLRSLDVEGCQWSLTHMPPHLGELTSLHKLPIFIVKSRSSPSNSQLRDLKTLNNLNGYLKIELYVELEDPASEAKETNLISKHDLTRLFLQFRNYKRGKLHFNGSNHDNLGCVNRSNHDEAVLEGLKPHENLKELEIWNYEGQKLPSWAMTDSLCVTLPNLVEIRLVNFDECRHVPCFSQLPFLKCLTLEFLGKVEYMEKSVGELESTTRTFFPSLQELVLRSMYNLKGWWEEIEAIDCNEHQKISHESTQCHLPLLSFCGLAKLRIEDCRNLVSFPLCPNVEKLTLNRVNKQVTVLKKLTSTGGNSNVGSPEYSSKLKSLEIDEVEILRSVPEECLGHLTSLVIRDSELSNTSEIEEVFKRPSSLTSLKFYGCHKLTTITGGMEHLVSLNTLQLLECPSLDITEKGGIEEGMPWKALKSLRKLYLHLIPNLKHLPSGLQHLTNLRSLTLDLENLEEVPEWIGCLSSLEYMELWSCEKLRSLPEEMRKLTNLNQLRIDRCHGLTKRCRGPNGEDWPYIQHIPLLFVK